MTVKEMALKSGVSVRTLHHYDKIGLLPPAEVTQAGYRLYGEQELAMLQLILFYRELEFPLCQIQDLLHTQDRKQAILAQRELLLLKRSRLDGLIDLTQRILEGESTMSFAEFNNDAYQALREEYAAQAKAQWGTTPAYGEYEKKTRGYETKDWEEIQGEMQVLFQQIAASMEKPANSPQTQALVAEWQALITQRFYHCTPEILQSLGEMYTADPRFQKNLDHIKPGLARYLSEAIAAFVNQA